MKATYFLALNKTKLKDLKSIFILVFTLFSFALQAQDYIAFNDPNMKAAVLANPDDIDTNNDGEIQFSEAEDFTGTLDLSSSSISDATGLEYFVNITELRIANNSLITLDLTANDKLTVVEAQLNYSLISINLNGLSSLERLSIYHTNLSTIKLNTNTNLNYINISNSNLNYINFQYNTNLRIVDVSDNTLQTLDLSNAPNLEFLRCDNNNLIGLNLITSGTHNTPSNTLECDNNPNLTCINVKFPTTFTAVVPNVTIPSGASFSDSCDIYIDIPDGNFEQKLIDLGIDTDATLNQVMLKSDAEAVTGILNVESTNIWDLTGINYFTGINQLKANNNSISEIDVSNLTGLSLLVLSNNILSEIDLTNNTALVTFQISNNNLSEIDLSHNTALRNLTLSSNQLTGINLYNNSSLRYVHLSNNHLPNLVMANHHNLVRLDCDNNGMSGVLFLESATSLTILHCENNQMENSDIRLGSMGIQTFIANDNLLSDDLDFSELTNLTSLNIANNVGVIGVDLRTGNNTAITHFDATGCTVLQNVCVDDAAWSATATGWSVDDTSVYSTCLIEIPDSDFEQALMDLGIDTYLDATSPATPNGYINASDVDGVTNLPLSNKSISDFTGINYFTDLEILVANNNALRRIDVSALSNLKILNLKNNHLDSYYMTLPNPSNLRRLLVDHNEEFAGGNHFNDVIANQNRLKILTLADNNAQVLDLTNFPDLIEVDCSNNPDISSLDVSACTHLRKLIANDCSISTLDVSSIHSLDEIRVQNNAMTSLTLGLQPHFNSLRCFNNNLTELNVAGAPHLGFLSCSGNQIVSLDISHNHELGYLGTSFNAAMTTLNLNNGNNATTLNEVYATNLGSGCCIQVDDVTNIPTAWHLDTTDTTISNDCTPAQTYVPDNAFESWLITNGYDTTMDDYVDTANIEVLTTVDVQGEGISDLTGIEDFAALEVLNAKNNNLTLLDLHSNTSLRILDATNNDLSSVNVDSNPALEALRLDDNELVNLNIVNNTNLQVLTCADNQLIGLDIGLNTHITKVNLPNNQLEFLNIKNGNNTVITQFVTTGNPNLSCVNVDDAAYSTTNWPDIDTTTSFDEHCHQTYVPDNNFEAWLITNGLDTTMDDYVNTVNIEGVTNLDVQGESISDLTGIEDFAALEVLIAKNNSLTTLDLSNNTLLRIVDVNNNNLTSINVANSPALEALRLDDNQLASLDVSNNTNLAVLTGANNSLTDLDLSLNTNITKLNVPNNQLTSLNIKNGNNGIITQFVTTGNPDLSCITVDDATYSTTNWPDIDATSSFDEHCHQTYVPDVNFEQALIDLGYDDVIDSYVLTANINTVTYLNLRSKGINDLTGIEDFVALNDLYVNYNNLTSLNLSVNTNLTKLHCEHNVITNLTLPVGNQLEKLYCENNQLTSIDVSGKTNLTKIDCDDNLLTSIDVSDCTNLSELNCGDNTALSSLNVTNNTGLNILQFNNTNINSIDLSNNADLRILDCESAALTDLDVTHNPSLIILFCGNNSLSQLNVTQNLVLSNLRCAENALTQLDVTHNSHLERLSCSDNSLTTLNLSNNASLTHLYCSDNSLTSLDLSNNPALENIYCTDNSLTSLSLKNGVTPIIIWRFSAENNPNLYCIEVEDPAYFNSHFSRDIDSQASFNTSCDVTLSVTTTGSGSVSLSPTGGTYYMGEVVSLTATPSTGWEFSGWSGDLSGTTNPANITMDADKNVTATFTRIQHTLTTSVTGNGSISLSPAGGTYDEGTTVTLTATPDTGWEFSGWSGDLTGTTNPANITMDADKNVTATFTRIQHTLTTSVTGNGSISLSPTGGTYNEGTTVTLTATPDTGWEFSGWSGDLTGTTNPANITMDADKNVTATFTRIQHTLTTSVTGNGSISLSPTGGTYDEGTLVTITATPDASWIFDSWSGDITGNTNPVVITMDADKNITALFTDTGSVNDENINSKIEIYPNPTDAFIHIEVSNQLSIRKISIFNIEGKELLEQTEASKVSLQNFERGVYFIKIETNKGIAIKRVIKE